MRYRRNHQLVQEVFTPIAVPDYRWSTFFTLKFNILIYTILLVFCCVRNNIIVALAQVGGEHAAAADAAAAGDLVAVPPVKARAGAERAGGAARAAQAALQGLVHGTPRAARTAAAARAPRARRRCHLECRLGRVRVHVLHRLLRLRLHLHTECAPVGSQVGDGAVELDVGRHEARSRRTQRHSVRCCYECSRRCSLTRCARRPTMPPTTSEPPSINCASLGIQESSFFAFGCQFFEHLLDYLILEYSVLL